MNFNPYTLLNDGLRKIGRLLSFPPALFCIFFTWFYFGNSWYPAATLVVNGTVPDSTTQLTIRWESGHGLNGYERKKYQLQPLPAYNDLDGIPLVITRTGMRNSASAGKKVVLRNIFIDEQKLIPLGEQLSPGVEFQNGTVLFKEDSASLKLKVNPKSSIRLEFPAFNRAGKVDVRIGEKTTRYDLYASNQESQWAGRYAKFVKSWFVNKDGQFSISMPMPRYRIYTLRVESRKDFKLSSTTISLEDGQTINLDGFEYRKGINFPMSPIDKQLKRHFQIDRFLFQIIFSILSTWLLISILRFAGRFSDLRDVFVREQRYLFWSMLLFSSLIFSFWHVSFWPGITSNDSLEVWRAAQIPGMYLGDHPPLNIIYYMYLSQLWNNVAVVPVAQNFMTSLLIAYVFFYLFRKGMPIYYLIPCYLFIALSIPIGLYTTILWKDVPYALLSVLLGFKLAALNIEKHDKKRHVSKKQWTSLFFLTLALVGLRHNGMLYVFIVPFVILLFKIVKIRPHVIGLFLLTVILLGSVFYIYSGSSKTTSYLVKQTDTYVTQAVKRASFKNLKKSGEKYLGVFNVNQKYMQWDLVHLCMYGRYTYDFLKYLRWNDVYPYLPFPKNTVISKLRETALALYWKSYEIPWVYFSWNPVYMLILLPMLPFMFRILPMTAVFSFFVLIPVVVLVVLDIFNWRYYFFAHLGSYFIVPMIITDLCIRKKKIAV